MNLKDIQGHPERVLKVNPFSRALIFKKSGPRKKVFGHFLLLDGSIWTETMLYDQGILLRRSGYPTCLQGHPERVLKVNPFARALIFTKSGFSGVFWDEK